MSRRSTCYAKVAGIFKQINWDGSKDDGSVCAALIRCSSGDLIMCLVCVELDVHLFSILFHMADIFDNLWIGNQGILNLVDLTTHHPLSPLILMFFFYSYSSYWCPISLGYLRGTSNPYLTQSKVSLKSPKYGY